MLWRRETRQEGSGRVYWDRAAANAVLVRDARECGGIEHVLYTDFNSAGKIVTPDPLELPQAAIASVSKAETGMDGISYLMDLISVGVDTLLSRQDRDA